MQAPAARLVCMAALLAAGCGTDTSISQPTPPLNVTGTWAGDVMLSTTPIVTRMTWALTQSDTGVGGPVILGLSSGTVLMNGALTGSLAASTLTYTIAVSSGGIPSQPSCSGQIGGTMTVTGGATPTMTGTPAVTRSTCSVLFPTIPLTLTRQ